MSNWRHGSKRWTKNKLLTLNTKDEALNVKLKHDSKCQTETNNGSERQNEDTTLNAELKEIWWIWTPN